MSSLPLSQSYRRLICLMLAVCIVTSSIVLRPIIVFAADSSGNDRSALEVAFESLVHGQKVDDERLRIVIFKLLSAYDTLKPEDQLEQVKKRVIELKNLSLDCEGSKLLLLRKQYFLLAKLRKFSDAKDVLTEYLKCSDTVNGAYSATSVEALSILCLDDCKLSDPSNLTFNQLRFLNAYRGVRGKYVSEQTIRKTLNDLVVNNRPDLAAAIFSVYFDHCTGDEFDKNIELSQLTSLIKISNFLGVKQSNLESRIWNKIEYSKLTAEDLLTAAQKMEQLSNRAEILMELDKKLEEIFDEADPVQRRKILVFRAKIKSSNYETAAAIDFMKQAMNTSTTAEQNSNDIQVLIDLCYHAHSIDASSAISMDGLIKLAENRNGADSSTIMSLRSLLALKRGSWDESLRLTLSLISKFKSVEKSDTRYGEFTLRVLAATKQLLGQGRVEKSADVQQKLLENATDICAPFLADGTWQKYMTILLKDQKHTPSFEQSHSSLKTDSDNAISSLEARVRMELAFRYQASGAPEVAVEVLEQYLHYPEDPKTCFEAAILLGTNIATIGKSEKFLSQAIQALENRGQEQDIYECAKLFTSACFSHGIRDSFTTSILAYMIDYLERARPNEISDALKKEFQNSFILTYLQPRPMSDEWLSKRSAKISWKSNTNYLQAVPETCPGIVNISIANYLEQSNGTEDRLGSTTPIDEQVSRLRFEGEVLAAGKSQAVRNILSLPSQSQSLLRYIISDKNLNLFTESALQQSLFLKYAEVCQSHSDNDPSEAEVAYRECLRIIKQSSNKNTRAYIHVLKKLEHLYSLNDFKTLAGNGNAEQCAGLVLQEIVSLYEADPSSDLNEKASAYLDLGEWCRLNGKSKEAIHWFQKSGEIWAKFLKESDRNLVILPMHRAWCWHSLGQYDKAKADFLLAVRRRKMAAQAVHDREQSLSELNVAAFDLSNAAECAALSGNLEEADVLFRQAIQHSINSKTELVSYSIILNRLFRNFLKRKRATEFQPFYAAEILCGKQGDLRSFIAAQTSDNKWLRFRNPPTHDRLVSILRRDALSSLLSAGKEHGSVEKSGHVESQEKQSEIISDFGLQVNSKNASPEVKLATAILRSDGLKDSGDTACQLFNTWSELFDSLSSGDDSELFSGLCAIQFALYGSRLGLRAGNLEEVGFNILEPVARNQVSVQNKDDRLNPQHLEILVTHLVLGAALADQDAGSNRRLRLALNLAGNSKALHPQKKHRLLLRIAEVALARSAFAIGFDALTFAVQNASHTGSTDDKNAALIELAKLSALRGDNQKARTLASEVYSLSGGKGSQAMQTACRILSISEQAEGHIDLAKQYAGEALEMAQKYSASEMLEAPYRIRYAELAFSLGEYSEARKYLASAARCLRLDIGYPSTHTSAHNVFCASSDEASLAKPRSDVLRAFGALEAAEGQHDKSQQYYSEANKYLQNDKSTEGQLNALVVTNSLARSEAIHSDPEAIRNIFESSRRLETMVDTIFPQLSFAEKVSFLDAVNDQIGDLISICERDPKSLERAYRFVSEWKGLLIDSLRDECSSQRTKNLELRAELAKIRTQLSQNDIDSDVKSLVERKEDIERQLANLPNDERVRQSQNSVYQLLTEHLNSDEVILDFCTFTPVTSKISHYGVVCLSKNQCRFVDLGELPKINKFAHQWLASLEQQKNFRSSKARRSKHNRDVITTVTRTEPRSENHDEKRLQQSLSEEIWEKVKPNLPTMYKTIYVVPEGELAKIPPQIYLGADFSAVTLSQLNSTRELAWFKAEQQNLSSKGRKRVLVVGDIDFAVAPRLSGSRTELYEISKLARAITPDVQVLKKEQATKSRIKLELPEAKYTHIATHGYFLNGDDESLGSSARRSRSLRGVAGDDSKILSIARNPLLCSGLIVAADSPESKDSDGNLTAEELLELDLRNCNLVTLSACETALGKSKSSQGILGLRASLIGAGARSLLMSLWKVDDDATQVLMREFYKGIWEDGLTKSESLYRAQQKIKSVEKWKSPYYWGAWILVGDPN